MPDVSLEDQRVTNKQKPVTYVEKSANPSDNLPVCHTAIKRILKAYVPRKKFCAICSTVRDSYI
jgi:hypothetical protein